MKVMKDRINSILQGIDKRDELRYVMYNAHDIQISNLLEFLRPTDFDYDFIPYSSQIYIELHYDEQCVKTKRDTSCFSVKVLYNGTALKFESCLDSNQQKGIDSTDCMYEDMLTYLQSISYTEDLDAKCSE